MREWECTTSLAVNSPKPLWNCTPLRKKKVHSFKSGLACHFSARRGTNSPVLGSTSSKVSKKGSNWRCSGRATFQKRLLSEKPAEEKMTRWTVASPADVG